MITLEMWVTSSGRYPERTNSPELTEEVLQNARTLLDKVNSLLKELNWQEPVSVSSGFRPSQVNANVKGAAKKSAHQNGKAIDLFQDKKDKQKLGFLIREKQKNDKILERHGLMMESLEETRGKISDWIHCDIVKRSYRPSCEFKP